MRHLKSLNLWLVIITVFTFQAVTGAQTPAPTATPRPKNPEDEVIKVSSRLVVVPVSVTDTNGQAVMGLTAQDFRISEEGRPQTIESVGTAETVPLEITLLFDISATTSPMFRFQQETAAKFLQDVMRPNDRATVYTIGTSPVLVHARDTAEMSVIAVKSIMTSKESTAFFDTVSSAAEYLQKNAPKGTRRVIVVISDGEDTNSAGIAKALQDGYKKVSEKINTMDRKTLYNLTVANRDAASIAERAHVLRSLQNADTVFYSINPAGSSYQLNQISVFGQTNMQSFAEQTGGTAFLPKFQPIDTKDGYQNSINTRKNTEILDRIFLQLANELRSQYLIQYYSESDFPLEKFVKLDVGVPKRTGTSIRARLGYYVKN